MLSVMQSPHGSGLPYPPPLSRPPALYGSYHAYPPATSVLPGGGATMRIKTEPDQVFSCCAG